MPSSSSLILRTRGDAEALSALGHLNMAQGYGQGVCRIRRFWRLCHSQQSTNHLLYLLFSGMPVSGNDRLHLTRRVTEGWNAALRRSKQNDAANLSEPQSRFYIERGKDGFERHRTRLKLANQFGNQPMVSTQMMIGCQRFRRSQGA